MTASLKKKKTEDEFEKERKDTKSKRKKKTAVKTVENRSSAIEDNMMDREKDP